MTYFPVAFATSGDQTTIPNTGTETGTVNFTYGYGSNYQASLETNPSAIAVDRQTFNYLMYEQTLNWQALYQTGTVPWITTAENLGTPFSYAANAIVLGPDGNNYFSLTSANTTTPGVASSSWELFNPSWLAHKGILPLSSITGGTYSFAGLGAGLTLTYTVTSGVITGITSLGGVSHTGYAVGDLLTPNAGNFDAVLVVTAVSGSSPLGVGILYGGSGFTAGSGVATQNAFAHFGKISLAGTLTSNATFIVPNGTYLQAARSWIVSNNTTGAFTTQFFVSNGSDATTGSGVVIPQGTSNSAEVIIDTDGSTDVWFSNSGTGSTKTPSVLSSTSINAKTVANTSLYTVPAGKTATITGAVVRCTAASAITIGPSAGIGNTAGTSNIFASSAMTTLTAVLSTYGFQLSGASLAVATGGIVYFNLGTAATGTSQTIDVDLIGYLS